MYAVVETGGKQYRVELGTEIEIDRLEAVPGETIELGRVLLLADGEGAQVGRPVVDGATVSANVVRQDRADKVVVFKYRPKARRRVKHGHRQDLTIVRVSDIVFNGRSAASEAAAQAREAEAQRKVAEEEAAKKAAADRALADKLEREQRATQAEQKAQAKPARGRRAKAHEPVESAAEGARATDATTSATAADESAQMAEADEATEASEAAPESAPDTDSEQPAQTKRSPSKKDE